MVNRIKGGGTQSIEGADLSYWKRIGTGNCSWNSSSGMWSPISNGGAFSQMIDFTNAPTLKYKLASVYQIVNTCKTYIDGELINTTSCPASDYAINVTVDVSAITGVHELKFVLSGGNGLGFGSITLFSNDPPIANFNTSFANKSSRPKEITFSDQSTETPTSWLWDFGDGQTSVIKSPVHTYADFGTYTVTLTATNAFGSHRISKLIETAYPPISNFSATPAGGLTIDFKDLSTNNPTSWLWDFGEIEDKTRQNLTHTYQKAGTYTVKLTATNADGNTSKTISIPVTVTAPMKPIPDFSQTIPNANAPLVAQFTDLTSGSPSSWLWNFGDGEISAEQNPVHTYLKSGLYTVFLSATVNGEIVQTSKIISIQPGLTSPPSDTATPSTVSVNTRVTITLKGSGFKSGSKVRIIKPNFWGVAQVISISPSQVVFSFFFGPEFSGSCGVAVISSSGKSILFDDVITVV